MATSTRSCKRWKGMSLSIPRPPQRFRSPGRGRLRPRDPWWFPLVGWPASRRHRSQIRRQAQPPRDRRCLAGGRGMRRTRAAFLGCVIALTTSLLLGRTHPFGDAALYAARSAAGGAPAPMMEHSSVPPAVQATLAAKCADCHSLQTRPVIYGRFAPVSWLMERDILEGRKQMNFSLWNTYIDRSAADSQGQDRTGGEVPGNATTAVSNDPLERAHHRR